MRRDARPAHKGALTPAVGALAVAWTLARRASDARVFAVAGPCAVGAAAFVVYLQTLAPTVMWYDMGEFATASATLGIAHNTGYPLLILLGKLFTLLPLGGDAAYRVNMLSAVSTAGAIALAFVIIYGLTRDALGAAAGALILAFTSTVWANATWATSYGLNLMLTALVLALLFAWNRDRSPRLLAAAAFVFGLGLCNHRLIVLTALPALIVLAASRRDLSPRTAALSALAILAGLSIYLYLPVRGEQDPALSWARPATWHTYWSMFLNGQTPAEYWRLDIADRIDVLWAYPAYDFTRAGLALAGVGAIVAFQRQRVVAIALTSLLLADAALVETYSIHNIYNYLTPGYLALAVFAGIAIARGREVALDREHAAPEIPAWSRIAVVVALAFLLPAALIARNHARVDRSSDTNARDFARTTLERLAPGSVVLTDSWGASPFWYVELVDGVQRDILVSPIFSVPGEDVRAFAEQRLAEGRSVYVVDGLRTPHDAFGDGYALQPVVLDGAEQMVVNTLPKPEYRDDLVMAGSLYKLVRDDDAAMLASLRCDSGCITGAPLARDAGHAVTVEAFSAEPALVARGDVSRLTFVWRAPAVAPARDLSAITLFVAEDGSVPQRHGFPRWSQTRQIAAPLLPVSKWAPGELVRESYVTLVPGDIPRGRYTVHVAVFDASDPADVAAAQSRLVAVGTIDVD